MHLKKKSLADLTCGHHATISGYNLNNPIINQLREMGLTIGTKITVGKVAPLGDPFQIKLRDYSLSIRKSDAQSIFIS